MTISLRSKKISPSQTLSISALSNQLIAQNKPVINLAVGQPNFPTPDNVKQAAIKAIQNNMTRYTAVDGTAELKRAIINKFKCQNNLNYKENNIIVSNGAKHSLSVLCQAVLDKGDEVIVPSPFWTTYPEIIKLSDAEPAIITTDIHQNFKITASQLEKSINKNTKMLIINSPNNPSGSFYNAEELLDLAEVLKRHPHVLICSDDIYEHFLFANQKFVSILNVCPELYDRTIIVNGVSKAYSMTGWRIGYAAGNEEIIGAMKKIQSQSTSNPCSISQAAAQEALNSPAEYLDFVATAFVKQRDTMVRKLETIDGLEICPPDGGFYVLPNFSKIIERMDNLNNDLELAEYLLNEFYIATVPGTAFGVPNHLRFSFSVDLEDVERATDKLVEIFG